MRLLRPLHLHCSVADAIAGTLYSRRCVQDTSLENWINCPVDQFHHPLREAPRLRKMLLCGQAVLVCDEAMTFEEKLHWATFPPSVLTDTCCNCSGMLA
eukprot:3331422-Heterocapsa_arctica.AAC.1